MSKKLIAMVATAVIIDGQRTVIPPGGELPELPKHDEQELKASGAAKDALDDESAKRAADKAQRKADAEFEEERQRVQAAATSTKPDTKVASKPQK